MAHEEHRPFDLAIEVKEGLVDLRTRVGHVESELVEVRTRVGHVESDLSELRQDLRRLDTPLFQLLLAQVATLATAMGALVATLAS